jgi:hypothetical protein
MESGLVLIQIRDLLAYNSGRISDIVWTISGISWENIDYRSYTFEANDDMDASMRETAESRKRRGKTGMQLTRVEQWRLFDMAMQRLEDQEQARREREQAWGGWGRGW